MLSWFSLSGIQTALQILELRCCALGEVPGRCFALSLCFREGVCMTTSLAKINCPWDARVCAKNSSTGPPAARVHGTGQFTKLRGTFVTTYTLSSRKSTTHRACAYTNHFLLISLGTNACTNRNSDNINCHHHPQFAKTRTRPLQQKRVCVHAKEYGFSKGDVPRATTTTTCSAKNYHQYIADTKTRDHDFYRTFPPCSRFGSATPPCSRYGSAAPSNPRKAYPGGCVRTEFDIVPPVFYPPFCRFSVLWSLSVVCCLSLSCVCFPFPPLFSSSRLPPLGGYRGRCANGSRRNNRP